MSADKHEHRTDATTTTQPSVIEPVAGGARGMEKHPSSSQQATASRGPEPVPWRAAHATMSAITLSEQTQSAVTRFEEAMKRPSVRASIAGAMVLGAAAFLGLLEATLAAGSAFVANRLLKTRRASDR